jgi:2-dehydro-3-deoxyphosphooctonate aldolase (KDO 8-P synthase)
VNIKKGQFLAPWDIEHAVLKVRNAGNDNVMVTERGVSFGYNTLVVDFRALPRMRALGCPVCFDATHSVQLPEGSGTPPEASVRSSRRWHAPAVAVGVDAVFFEVHDDPDGRRATARARSRWTHFPPFSTGSSPSTAPLGSTRSP